MQQRIPKRHVDGVLLLDKPTGMSSNYALQKVKRLFAAYKAGHTGSLDPLASGMLPICLGEATKFSQHLLDAHKTYQVTAQLGVKTATGDKEGQIIQEAPVPELTETQLLTILQGFLGETMQTPSMFSALKFQGQPLYKLARQGIEVERAARAITVFDLQLLEFTGDTFTLKVRCSKGTYIRNLVEDIGGQLGCGAHVTFLRRLEVGHFVENQMITLETLAELTDLDRCLLPLDVMLQGWPMVEIAAGFLANLRNGQTVPTSLLSLTQQVKMMCQGKFLGIGEVLSDGRVAPRRLVATR